MSSGDDQSEDGELRGTSPGDLNIKRDENLISMSEDEGEVLHDALDIKPPQAKLAHSSKSSRKKEHGTDRTRHKKSSVKSRDERHVRRIDKQQYHRESRDYHHHHQRERDKDNRQYREKNYEHSVIEPSSSHKSHRERKEDRSSRHHHYHHHHQQTESGGGREIRYVLKEPDKQKRRHDDEKRGDRTLNDLRERLLSKRKIDDDGSDKKSREERRHKRKRQSDYSEHYALEGESGMYVKEIINLSGGEERTREKTDCNDELNEKERAEQDQRREKLLEAEREMARLKEQSRLDRERRLDKDIKYSRRKEELEEHYSKRVVNEEEVSENDDDDDDEEPEAEDSPEKIPDDDDEEQEEEKTSDDNSSRSASRTRSRSRESSDRSSEKSDDERVEDDDDDDDKNRIEEEEKPVVENVEPEAESPKTKKIDEDLPPYFPAISGCRSVEEFQCLNRIEEGTYGVVYRARDKRTEEIVALKRLKMEKEKEGFPITSLREINTLLKGQHKNIVTVREIVVGSNMDKIFIVMDYVEHDLKSLMETMRHKKQCFTPAEVKCLLQQLLLAVAHLHDNWILHRDLKTSNLLLSHKGILKVGDFGLAREYGSPLKAYTPIVVTLWYRAPELLLCTKEYSTPIDVWSVGCIYAELTLMNALFPGKTEVDQLNRIFKELGTPNEDIWRGFNKLPAVQKMKFIDYPKSNLSLKFRELTDSGLDLLLQFLTYDPWKRITAEQALKHPYFKESPLPIDPAMFPTWPAKSELGQKRALLASPKPPSGGGEYKKLGKDDDYGFRLGMAQDRNRGVVLYRISKTSFQEIDKLYEYVKVYV